MYGTTTAPGYVFQKMQQKGPFLLGQRQSLNIVAILISLFVPWFIFCAVAWLLAFSLHYHNYLLCYFVVFCIFLIVLFIGYGALLAIKRKIKGDYYEPTWWIFLFATSLLAFVLGLLAGNWIYVTYLEPYFEVTNLNTYDDVDPAYTRGQQLMDGGRVIFTNTTQLDLKRSMGFKNLDLYCVAPIVSSEEHVKDPKKMPQYDFWAVGKNCCAGDQAGFHCDEFNNARARAGLRLMRDEERGFYRLAVQQAEAAYNIKASHPLFYHWTQDPIAEMEAMWDAGVTYYLLAMVAHFILQLFMVIIACIAFSKLGKLGTGDFVQSIS